MSHLSDSPVESLETWRLFDGMLAGTLVAARTVLGLPEVSEG